MVITLAAVANLVGTALTITIYRDWIVSLIGDNTGQLWTVPLSPVGWAEA